MPRGGAAGHLNMENSERGLGPNTIVIEDPTLSRGFTAVPNVIFGVRGLSHGARLLYVLLLKYAWREGSCYPGTVRLAEDLEVERKAVIRYIRELVARTLVTVMRRGLGLTNVYRINAVPAHLLRDHGSEADVPKMGHQEVPPMSHLEVPSMGHKEDTGLRKIQNGVKNAEDKIWDHGENPEPEKDPYLVSYLVEEIVHVCGDDKSRPFYELVAGRLPERAIFRFLAEIKQDSKIRNKGAVFTSKVKEHLAGREDSGS